MKKFIIIAAIAGMFVWAIYDFVVKSGESTLSEESAESMVEGNVNEVKDDLELKSDEVGLDRGNIAPDFQLNTLDGQTVKLSDFRGKKVMLNFWATWCLPCRAEMPDMEKFHENKDVVILAVNLTKTEDNLENVSKFIEEFGVTFRVLLDETTEVAHLYQVQPIPTTFIIDSNGRINNKAIGALNYDLMVQVFEMME